MDVLKVIRGVLSGASIFRGLRKAKDEAAQTARIASGEFEKVILLFLHKYGSSTEMKIRAEVKANMQVMKAQSVDATNSMLEKLLAKGEIVLWNQHNSGKAQTAKTPHYLLTDKGRARIGVPAVGEETK